MDYIPHCLKCNRAYNNDYRSNVTSYLLSCAHHVCNTCIKKISQPNSAFIACPICLINTELLSPGNWKSLPKDIYAHGLILIGQRGSVNDLEASFNNFKYRPAVCSKKEDFCIECGHNATCRCNKCEDVFCGVCFDKIHQGNALKKHMARPLQEDDPTKVKEKLICPEHANNNRNLYCDDCVMVVCQTCISDNHSDHKYVTVTEKNELNLRIVDEFVKMGLVEENICKETKQGIASLKNLIKKKQTSIIASIGSKFHQLFSLLQLKQLECNRIVENKMISESEKLDELEQQLSQLSSDLHGVLKYAINLRRNSEQTLIDMDEAKLKFDAIFCRPCYIDFNANEFSHDWQIDSELLVKTISSFLPVFTGSNDLNLKPMIDEEGLIMLQKESLSSDCIEQLTDRLGLPKCRPLISNTKSIQRDTPRNGSTTSESSSSNSTNRIPVGIIPPSRNLSLKNEIFQVNVKSVQNPQYFSVHLVNDLQLIERLSADIQSYCYINNKHKPMINVPEGGWVLANYKVDNKWYRAKVLTVKPVEKVAEIYYLDFGNSDKVSFSRLMKMPDYLASPQPLAYLCSLVDIVPALRNPAWPKEATELFHKIVSTKTMIMHVLDTKDNFLYVDLSAPILSDISNDGPCSLRDIFVFFGLACFNTEYSRSLEQLSPRLFPTFIKKKKVPTATLR